jgi:hypothetical protein
MVTTADNVLGVSYNNFNCSAAFIKRNREDSKPTKAI